MDIGKSLKVALAINDINRAELAQRVGVSQRRIGLWMCNGAMTMASLKLVCKALDMPVSEFVRYGES